MGVLLLGTLQVSLLHPIYHQGTAGRPQSDMILVVLAVVATIHDTLVSTLKIYP